MSFPIKRYTYKGQVFWQIEWNGQSIALDMFMEDPVDSTAFLLSG